MSQTKSSPDIPAIKLVDPSYSPSREELAEDLRVDATFEEALHAVTRTVRVEFVKPKKRRR